MDRFFHDSYDITELYLLADFVSNVDYVFSCIRKRQDDTTQINRQPIQFDV